MSLGLGTRSGSEYFWKCPESIYGDTDPNTVNTDLNYYPGSVCGAVVLPRLTSHPSLAATTAAATPAARSGRSSPTTTPSPGREGNAHLTTAASEASTGHRLIYYMCTEIYVREMGG
jgi:hypothetical protein